MNDSTHRFVKNNLKRLNRVRLLRLGTKLMCFKCNTLRNVTDFFNGSDVAELDCKHRRPAFNRTEQDIRTFDEATAEREARRQVAGKNRVNANGYCVTFVEDCVEDIAAEEAA